MNDIEIKFYRIKHFTKAFKKELNELFKRNNLDFEADFICRYYYPDSGYDTVEAGFISYTKKKTCKMFEYFRNLFGEENIQFHPDKLCIYPTSEQFLILYNVLSKKSLSKEEFEKKYLKKRDMFTYFIPEEYDTISIRSVRPFWQLDVEGAYVAPLLTNTRYCGTFNVIRNETDKKKMLICLSVIKFGEDIFDCKPLGNCKNFIKKFSKQFQEALQLEEGTIHYDSDSKPTCCVIVYPYTSLQLKELKKHFRKTEE